VLIASLSVGDEFRFGTIRTSLLASSDRRRFLAARLASLVAITVGVFAALILLGTILGIGLAAIGADLGANTTKVDGASAAVWLGAQVLTTVVVIALATALSVLLRSGALPLLLILVGGLVDLAVAHLPVFAPNELLSGVPQAFLGQSIRTLTAITGIATHALALSDPGDVPYQAIEVPLIAVAAVIAVWGVLFILIADRRLRTMDVVE
jgi:ABC-type transport system involved in multi-copper enzyme maturation permease subunit